MSRCCSLALLFGGRAAVLLLLGGRGRGGRGWRPRERGGSRAGPEEGNFVEGDAGGLGNGAVGEGVSLKEEAVAGVDVVDGVGAEDDEASDGVSVGDGAAVGDGEEDGAAPGEVDLVAGAVVVVVDVEGGEHFWILKEDVGVVERRPRQEVPLLFFDASPHLRDPGRQCHVPGLEDDAEVTGDGVPGVPEHEVVAASASPHLVSLVLLHIPQRPEELLHLGRNLNPHLHRSLHTPLHVGAQRRFQHLRRQVRRLLVRLQPVVRLAER
mmetsp:Transcript_11397/g.37455  ORF Transcript_11397/g.37455 Transcript_11397/m.37455 type:complete len:267 (-) Transcript_11397:121-921(-)